MATGDDKVDDLDEPSAEKPKKDKSGMMKIILIAVGATVFLGVNGAITYFLTQSASNTAAPSAAESEQAAEGGGDGEGGDDKADDKNKGESIYFKFDPAFIVNFQAGEELRFLQVELEVMAHDQAAISAVEQHMPVLRNNLIVLFSSQDFTTISTRVGKERIRAQVLSEIQKILREKIGNPGIEEVYFTAFVMQ